MKNVADGRPLLERVGVLDSGVTEEAVNLALSKAQQIEVMKRIETSAFFQLMLNTSIHSLHVNREVAWIGSAGIFGRSMAVILTDLTISIGCQKRPD